MVFHKIGKFAPLDQVANLGKTPGRMSLVAMMIRAFMFVVMMLMLMLMVVRLMPMIMFVTGFAVIRGRAIRFMRVMTVVLRGIVRCPGVNVEFYP